MGDYEYYRDSTVVLELLVPDQLCLLSSYWAWNDVLEYCTQKRSMIVPAKFETIFDEPLFRHETDDIQAVIPWILPEWIVDVRDLPESDADFELLI